jgi:hypothetical protein
VRTARQRCWRYDWVLDLDVKASPHLMAVERY